jgi:hypothetical protein
MGKATTPAYVEEPEEVEDSVLYQANLNVMSMSRAYSPP